MIPPRTMYHPNILFQQEIRKIKEVSLSFHQAFKSFVVVIIHTFVHMIHDDKLKDFESQGLDTYHCLTPYVCWCNSCSETAKIPKDWKSIRNTPAAVCEHQTITSHSIHWEIGRRKSHPPGVSGCPKKEQRWNITLDSRDHVWETGLSILSPYKHIVCLHI